jgi:RNA polymerase primary sigma factor
MYPHTAGENFDDNLIDAGTQRQFKQPQDIEELQNPFDMEAFLDKSALDPDPYAPEILVSEEEAGIQPEEVEEDELEVLRKIQPALLEDNLADVDTNDMVRMYITEAIRVPLLTADEEVNLAQRIERGLMGQQELARGNVAGQRLTQLRRLIEDGHAAQENLIQSNALLVISVAKKYIGRGVPFLDLIQEGNIGLMRAARKFEYRRGFKFSTYATWWIRQAITRALADQSRTIRLPAYMSDLVNRMLRSQQQLHQKLGRQPNTEELAAVMEMTVGKVEEMIKSVQQPLSLQSPISDEDDEEFGDLIEDSTSLDPEGNAIQTMLREDLTGILDELPVRELKVLQMRFGLLDGEAMTLSEVGQRLGISRERARQIEAQALGRLRKPVIQGKLRAYTE